VATNIGGYGVLCQDNEMALVCESANVRALTDVIERLISDTTLRERIAHNGYGFIQQFTWDKAYSKLKNSIENS
jgi:glycosyltransferase involved in cell wall biosynthesis